MWIFDAPRRDTVMRLLRAALLEKIHQVPGSNIELVREYIALYVEAAP